MLVEFYHRTILRQQRSPVLFRPSLARYPETLDEAAERTRFLLTFVR
jgi:hypothetical protein